MACKVGFGNAVHAVHYSTVGGEDDGVAQVRFFDETGMVSDGPASRHIVIRKPERLVEFADGGERDVLVREMGGTSDEVVHIPDEATLG